MAEQNRESVESEEIEDFFEPVVGDLPEEDFQEDAPVSTEKQRLAAKRRRAEQRLEERRMRDELGYYDLEFEDL